MADLTVELYGHPVGRLVGADARTFDFVVDPGAFERFELNSVVMSVSAPLVFVHSRTRAARRRNFFAELLPEGDMRVALAAQIGSATRPDDVISLLSHYGRDVAGALQIYDPERPGEPRTPRISRLANGQVGELMRDVARMPLGNRPVLGKSSLAGVQNKIVLVRADGHWHQALDGYATTHILKPASVEHPTLIYDEEYGLRIARAVGLAVFDSHIDDFDGLPALVIERYDRAPQAPDGRLHQEDMNQALGAGGIEKYQELGGRVSLARMAAIFARRGDSASLERLLSTVTMAVATGNLDLHAKNISILHPLDEAMTLAPAYDCVPQAHLANDGRMALAVAGEYVHAALTRGHLEQEGMRWGVTDADAIVAGTLDKIAQFVATSEPVSGSYACLADDISQFVHNLCAGRPVGSGR